MAGGEAETALTPDKAAELPAAAVQWAALEDSFFTVLFLPMVPGQPEAHALARGFRFTGVLPPRESGKPGKDTDWPEHVVLAAPFSAQSAFQTMYVGPRNREALQALDAALPGQHRVAAVMDLGFVEPIAALMHRLLLWLHDHTSSWGASILLLTLIIRALIFPLTHISLKKMRGMQDKMSVVKPKLDTIKTRYRKLPRNMENRQREQQETMALYQTAGINPADQLMGCLPLLLSMPFFWALFRLLPQASEFRHEPFLAWHDLSAADPTHAWPILTGATMWFSSRLSMASATNVDPMQKNMLYVFPLMFLWFTWSAPLGLVVYWTASNVIQIGQQYLLKLTAPSPAGGEPDRKPARKAGASGRAPGDSSTSVPEAERSPASKAGRQASPSARRRKR
jgi:YidC/Oxa1 family membrane protein insertase